jgi:hypothetical protein
MTFTPSFFFYFMLLFITIWFTDFYLFVLGSSLLISFLSHFVPVRYSTIGFLVSSTSAHVFFTKIFKLRLKQFVYLHSLYSLEEHISFKSL